MSCKKCREIQANKIGDMVTYYKWKDTIIELRGCNFHIDEITEALDRQQK